MIKESQDVKNQNMEFKTIKGNLSQINSQIEKMNTIEKTLQECKDVMSNVVYLSRLESALEKPLKVIDTEKMNYIVKNAKELNDKIYNFSKSNTQATMNLMSLTMLFPADTVYRQLQQILAQIESKQNALTENIFKIKKENIKIKKFKIKMKQLEEQLKRTTDELEKEKIKLDIEQLKIEIDKYNVSVANTMSYIEATIKEIGTLIDSYKQIKKNKNVPDDWSEKDVEDAEIKTNIKNAFRNAVRDFLVTGRIGMGTCEYLEQFGISPLEAFKDVADFINSNQDDYESFYKFLNYMAEKYKDNYKLALEKIGLDDYKNEKFLIRKKKDDNS